MNSTLKILVPLALLIGGVFALTFFSIYTPRDEEEKIDPTVAASKKPLQFFASRRQWLPVGGSLQDREFPGYFEPGENEYNATFWFANRSTAPVRIQLASVSCDKCSGGQVAAIPTDVTRQILQMTAVSALPQGLVSGFPLGMAGPAAHLDPRRDSLKWQLHMYSKPKEEVVYDVPGATPGDPWTEQWAILDLHFKVKAGSKGALTAVFMTESQGSKEQYPEQFEIVYAAAPPFEFDRIAIDVGELTDSSSSQTHEVLIFSSTRKPEELQKQLSFAVTMPPGMSGEPGPFVSFGALIPVPEDKLEELMVRLSQGQKMPVRVQSAFRLPVTISPKVGEAKLDIGRLERVIAATQGSDTKQIRVSGSMRGPIYLVGAKEIGFGYFSYADAQIATVNIESERSGLDLAIVKDLTQPKFLKVDLQKQPDEGGRGAFKLKVTIPAKEQLGEIQDGVVVLEAKGPNPQRLRIPITGRGR